MLVEKDGFIGGALYCGSRDLISELSSAQAMLKSAQSNLDYQKTNHDRYKALYDKGLISANDYEQARLSYVQAQL